MLTDGTLSRILSKLNYEQPTLESKRLASVSIMVTSGDRPRTLLIKRAERRGDPWSGQVAFPGGKMAKGDRSAKETAIRETKEEVGVDLIVDGSFSGYYRAFRTHTGDMDVIPAVFLLRKKARVVPNAEVSSYRWVELKEFLLPRSASTYRFEAGGATREMPAFAVGDYLVWGLTHRILSSLLGKSSL